MATDAAILVESLRNEEKNLEYLIFVKGDKFESSWSFAKALEEFCGQNTSGFELNYYSGISPEEFETRFANELSKVNILFARNPKELEALKNKFGISDNKRASKELLENDWMKPPESKLPAGDISGNANYRDGNHREAEDLTTWKDVVALIIAIIILGLAGMIWMLISSPVRGIYHVFRSLKRSVKNRQGT